MDKNELTMFPEENGFKYLSEETDKNGLQFLFLGSGQEWADVFFF